MTKPDSRLFSSIPIAMALAIAAASFVIVSMGLSGCSGSSLDWKSAFEKSDAFQSVLPASDHVKESSYKVTDFRTEVSKSNNNPDRQACTFGATIENDYFVMEVNGTGEEISKDGDMKFEVVQRQYCKAKAPIDVLEDSEWYLDGLDFTLNDDGTGCSAAVNKDIDTWFGTVHAEGTIEAELDNASNSNPAKQPRWSETSNVKLSLKKLSDKALGEYKFSHSDPDANNGPDGIVKQFHLKESNAGNLSIEFDQPEFDYTEISKVIVGTPKQWNSPSRQAALEEESESDFVASADGGFQYSTWLSETYPCSQNADFEMEDRITIYFDSHAEGEMRIDGSFLARRLKTLNEHDEYRIQNADKKNILLLNGIYSK
ncbi:MAG: hypothetical protein E7Z99_03295 [Coriobacteriaceae bacterium]|nr:hypothetical protein [Coriobacteriaceae bacterium]